jgi:signal transduction histidine kinase
MSWRSLRTRLLAAAAVSIALALSLAGLGLAALFERHATRQVEQGLDLILGQLLAHLETDSQGRLRVDPAPPDPRFDLPLSGLYWQVQDEGRHSLLRSRSLWDQVLGLPGDALPDGGLHRHRLPGPDGQSLLVLERRVLFRPGPESRPLRAAVALDRRELAQARRAFAADLVPYLAVLGVALVLAAGVQVRVGLAPLDKLRLGLKAVRSGAERRLPGEGPDEAMPLVEEVNALLLAQEGAIERARAWTADLAHGLKTPLVVLAADAERLRGLGQTEIADDLDRLAQSMRRRVDRELIRGRVRARQATRAQSGGASGEAQSADLGETLESLVRALGRTPAGRALDWDLDCPAGLKVALAPEDLAELLGNLLENATGFARRALSVAVVVKPESGAGPGAKPGLEPGANSGAELVVRIEDDGPGVPDESLPELGRRGLRLDQGTRGSGLGLAIALDICDAYGARLSFGRAALGGLAVRLSFPPAGPRWGR